MKLLELNSIQILEIDSILRVTKKTIEKIDGRRTTRGTIGMTIRINQRTGIIIIIVIIVTSSVYSLTV